MAGSGGSPTTVQEWLKALHLEQFLHDFLFSGYTDLFKCCHITEADLVQLGITQVGYQKRILSRLPNEADLAVMELTGQMSNGEGPAQPIPPPRRLLTPAASPLSLSSPDIDNKDYVEINSQATRGVVRRTTYIPSLQDRSKSEGDLSSRLDSPGNVSSPKLYGGPRPQKPMAKPRVKGNVNVKRDPPPPLPERGKPIPQPRTARPPRPISLRDVEDIPEEKEELPIPTQTKKDSVEKTLSSSSNPFRCTDESDEELVPVNVSRNPFSSIEDLMERPVPLPPPVANTEHILEGDVKPLDEPKSSPSRRIDLRSRPVPPPPFEPPLLPHPHVVSPPMPQLPPPILPSMEPSSNPTSTKPLPMLPSKDPFLNLSTKPLPMSPLLPTTDLSSTPSSRELPPNPPLLFPSTETSSNPLSTKPLPMPPMPTKVNSSQRPVQRPSSMSDAALMITPVDNTTSRLVGESQPPPLPRKREKTKHIKERNVVSETDVTNSRELPSVPQDDIPNQKEIPALPPRPIPPSNTTPVRPQEPLTNDNENSQSNVQILGALLKSLEVNGNIDGEELREPSNNLTESQLMSDHKALSDDSGRKSDRSCRSSQDDDNQMSSSLNWPDSDQSDVQSSELPVNNSSTMSSMASTESEKINGILDGYSSSDILMSRPDSVVSADDSQNQGSVGDEQPAIHFQEIEPEGHYGVIWDKEESKPSQAPMNIYKNPPSFDQSEEACYLPLVECSTGQPRPPSAVIYDMPDHPPPPLPSPEPLYEVAPMPDHPPPGLPDDHMYEVAPMAGDDISPALPPRNSPLLPARPAPPPPRTAPASQSSPEKDKSKHGDHQADDESGYDVLDLMPTRSTGLPDDHQADIDSGYGILAPVPTRSTGLHGSQDDVMVFEFTELRSDEESETEDFTITVQDGQSNSGSYPQGGNEQGLKRSSRVYTSIKNDPYQRRVPNETRKRLSMRLSSKGIVLNKLEKSGYLWKCGAGRQGRGGFRKRWFVFNGKELRYYENEKTMANCKGIIPVGSMLDVKHIYKTSIGDKKSRIELHTNARTYYFATDSCDDGTIWANILMQAIIDFQPPPGGFPKGGDMSCPDKEGYLKWEGINHKRYLAIKGERLCYYVSEKDFEAAIPISDIEMKLANARVSPQRPEKIVLTTPSTTFNLTADTAEEAKSWVDAMMEAVQEGLSDKLYLHEVWENKHNQLCADCNMPDPDWCSLNFGIVVCKKCSGIHRQLGVHVSKIRSLKMDVKAFTDTALEVFSYVGNKTSNEFWEKELEHDNGVKPMPDDSIEQRKLFIVKKYVDRQYCEQILWERSELDKELVKAVKAGNLIDCLRLIFSGANVETRVDEECSVKDLAFGHDASPVIRELLEQNKDYSAHQQDLMSNAGAQPSLFETQGHGPLSPLSTQQAPQGSPVVQPRRNTNTSIAPVQGVTSQGGAPPDSQGSPRIPQRQAPLPPSPSKKKKEVFVSSVGSINEQIRKAGYLFKTGSNRKDFQKRYCILEHGTFSYFQDEKAQSAKNVIEGTDMVYVAIYNQKGHDFCFEIGTTMGRLFLFEAEDEADRRNWMSALVKFHTPECMWNECADFEYAGFLRKKIGRASTQWHRLWFLLKGKNLSFYSTEKDGMEVIDLRKAKQISQDTEEVSTEQIKDIAIVIPGRTVYLRADTQQISDAWMAALTKNASQIGPELEDQLLTDGHIPHIIEECINFVYINQGLEQEGIYRLSGTASKISKVREMFKVNPRAKQIDRNEFEVNDVTSALKKYFRELPDPVLTKQWYSKWIEVSGYTDHNVKLQWYRYILDELPRVHYHTIKTIIAHLNRVKEKERINKMTEKNLASVFGPTLMALPDSSYGNAEKEIAVIGDLMTYYKWLFSVTDEEWEEEERGVQKLIQIGSIFNNSQNQLQPKSNSMVMPFYIRHKNEGNGITAPVSDTTTAKEVIDIILEKHRLPSLDGKEWGLFEVIENGELERMMFNYEVVLTEVGAWDSSNAATNYLCIKQNSLMQEISHYLKTVTSSATLKYADGSSKKFKECYFELSGSTMRYSKTGHRGSSGGAIHHWDIAPLRIYLGICPKLKKSAPTRHGITFLAPGEKDYKCLCFETEAVRIMWLAGLFRCKLTEPKKTPMQQLENAAPIRDRTPSKRKFMQSLRRAAPTHGD